VLLPVPLLFSVFGFRFRAYVRSGYRRLIMHMPSVMCTAFFSFIFRQLLHPRTHTHTLSCVCTCIYSHFLRLYVLPLRIFFHLFSYCLLYFFFFGTTKEGNKKIVKIIWRRARITSALSHLPHKTLLNPPCLPAVPPWNGLLLHKHP